MSDGLLSQPHTSPTEVPHSVGDKIGLKQPDLRRKRSGEAFHASKAASSSPSSSATVIHKSPTSEPSTPEAQKPAMFSTFFSHTEAQLPQGQTEMEAGDFDHTPAPSGRPSLEMLRDNDGELATVPEARAAPGTGHRHHLLKTSASGPMMVDKDCPAPPLLSPISESKRITLTPIDVKVEHENQGTLSTERFSNAPGTPSPFLLPSNGGLLPSIPAADRIRMESHMHTHDTHVHPHINGSLGAAGSCDATEASQDVIPIWPSPDRSSFTSSEFSVTNAEYSQALPGADQNSATTRKTIPHVRGQSRCVKVRPAFNYSLMDHQKHFEDGTGQNSRKTNKIRPCDSTLEHAKALLDQSDTGHGQDVNDRTELNHLDVSMGTTPDATSRKMEQNRSCEAPERRERYSNIELKDPLRASHDQSQAASSNPSGRSQSFGSVLAGMRTTQWLKGLANQPGSYEPRFTEIPPLPWTSKGSLTDFQRPSEPILSRRPTAKTTMSSKSDPRVDGLKLKRAVSDLERLLNEALSLASEVVDRSEAAAAAEYGRQFKAQPNGRRSSSSSEQSMHSAQESIDLSSADIDDAPCPIRPKCRHAATYSCPTKRPRLADIIENYSGKCQGIRARIFGSYLGQQPPPCKTSQQSPQVIPGRRASRQAILEQKQRQTGVEEHPTSTDTFLDFNTENRSLPEQTLVQKRSAAAHSSAAGRNATGQDAHPDRDVVGRKLHSEHGINLRRRSHVSLRNIQGFSLPKSHKRQPIARD
ncbi:hypothetical protein ACJZ2D_008951 [Fusarium nematophilum]